MRITLNEYITNPMQQSGRVYTAAMRNAQIKDYANKFNALIMREGGTVSYVPYKDEKKNIFYIHIKIPSEKVNGFYYDTVLKFYTDASVKNLGRDLRDYYVQFFTNDPAFIFTYANVFKREGIIVDELGTKLSKKVIKTPPNVTNPEGQVGYVKSLFFAYLFMRNAGLLNTESEVWKNAEAFNRAVLNSKVMDSDSKIKERIDLAKSASKKETRQDYKAEAKAQKVEGNNKEAFVPRTKTVNTTNTTKTVNTSKRNKKKKK